MTLNVVELVPNSLRDIPAAMEVAAQEIREAANITAGVGVFIDEAGDLKVFGWGDTHDIHSIGLLMAGASWLASHHVRR